MKYLTFKNVIFGLLILGGVRYTITEVIAAIKGDKTKDQKLSEFNAKVDQAKRD